MFRAGSFPANRRAPEGSTQHDKKPSVPELTLVLLRCKITMEVLLKGCSRVALTALPLFLCASWSIPLFPHIWG